MNIKSQYLLLLRDYLEPFLHDHGLKGKGSFFYIQNKLLLRALLIEEDKFNLPGKYGFRININITGLTQKIENPKDLIAVMQKGNIPVMTIALSELAGKQLVAYTVMENTDLPALAGQIQDDLKKYGLPILLNTDTLAAMETTVNRIQVTSPGKYYFPMAIFLATIGETEKSKLYFLKSPGDKGIIAKTAAQYGITL